MKALRVVKQIAMVVGLCFALSMSLVSTSHAQTVQYIGDTCTFSWDANTESDLAGYRAWAVRGSTSLPIVTLTKTATSHVTSTTCAALGVTVDGAYRFNVVAFDLAGSASAPAFVDVVKDGIAPTTPRNPRVTSSQPIAMSVTPNPTTQKATVAWIPGACQKQFIVSRLVNNRWIELGRTQENWLVVPLVNQVNVSYGVSAICNS